MATVLLTAFRSLTSSFHVLIYIDKQINVYEAVSQMLKQVICSSEVSLSNELNPADRGAHYMAAHGVMRGKNCNTLCKLIK